MRTIDRGKDSNIKCEHCQFFGCVFTDEHPFKYDGDVCRRTMAPKNYWNRCKDFEWRHGLNYKDQTQQTVL